MRVPQRSDHGVVQATVDPITRRPHMLRIVSQAIPPRNGERYQRAVAAARAALEQAIAVSVPADASFAERERAVLAAANDACRLALETTLQAVAHPDQGRGGGGLYGRHHEGTVVYHSLIGHLIYGLVLGGAFDWLYHGAHHRAPLHA